jgi:hypothetical protein
MPTSVITGGIVGAGLLGTAFMGAGMFGMTRGMVRGAKSGEGLFGEMFGKSLAKEAADAAGSLKTAAVEAASTTTTAAATSATATTTAAGTAAATTEGGATAAAVTTEGGAAGSAVTIEGGAGAAAGTLEGAAIGAGATTEGAAAVAAKTLEAGASAAAAELRAGGAGGFDGWSKNATGRTLTMPEKWQLAREAEASKGLLGGSGLQKAATAGGTSASILGGSFAAQLAGGLVLALPAAVAAGLALWYGSNAVKNAEAEDAAAKHRYDLNAIRVAKLTGMGDASNPDQAEYVGTYTNQYGMVFNARGQRLASYAEEWQIGSRQAQMNQRSQNLQMVNDLIRQQERHVRIILQDQTVSGVKASQIDTRSNSPNAF